MDYALVAAVIALSAISGSTAFDSRDVVFVIVGQEEPYHASMAAWLRDDIRKQVQAYEQREPTVYTSPGELSARGAWRIVPLLSPVLRRAAAATWLMFLEPHTAIRYPSLVETFDNYGPQLGELWIGYPLTDAEPTIIHHFATFDEFGEYDAFSYPNFASGFAITVELAQRLVKQIQSGERESGTDFSIDPSFELARLIYGGRKEPSSLLMGELSFCVVSAPQCTTYPRPFNVCGKPIAESSIYFAVKTWSGYHATRAHTVKNTWGAHVTHLQFFSDVADPSLPAIDLGVPNTKTGHCAKTIAILKYVTEKVKDMPHIQWIFLADDDTILGVSRLCEFLSCLRGGQTLTVAGERYGYGYSNKEDDDKGYDYVTGGGGTALSVAAAALLSQCACPAPDAPDDMTLGACAATHNLSLTHSPLFHQARPQDYSAEYLARDRPVSFHKHWEVDPVQVYTDWFEEDDLSLATLRSHLPDEL